MYLFSFFFYMGLGVFVGMLLYYILWELRVFDVFDVISYMILKNVSLRGKFVGERKVFLIWMIFVFWLLWIKLFFKIMLKEKSL